MFPILKNVECAIKTVAGTPNIINFSLIFAVILELYILLERE